MANSNQQYFHELANRLMQSLQKNEILLLNYEGEDSDFVRLNNNKVRQAGNVRQQRLGLNLICDEKQSTVVIQLGGNMQRDFDHGVQVLTRLREQLIHLPKDPNINYSTEPVSSESIADNVIPDAQQAIDEIISIASGLDLVGIWASGEMSQGFANSMGQFNWHSNANFNMDWSVYLTGDKAIKQNYAGFKWQSSQFQEKINFAKQTLEILDRPSKTIAPGHYRAYLAPAALLELFDLLAWGGFGLKSHRTAQTPLIKMVKDNIRLSEKVTAIEQLSAGLAPKFTRTGFIKPDQVTLIENGVYKQCLASARSAKEYNEVVNSNDESPQSLHLHAGLLPVDNVFKQLDTGIYISNLWYCNYSDRNHCRITGMTRFASLWVENGKPVAPINVMRFDESLFHLLGEKLEDFTQQREHIFDASSYDSRSNSSALVPGALVRDFRLTL